MTDELTDGYLHRIRELLELLYPEVDSCALAERAAEAVGVDLSAPHPDIVEPLDLWSERDVLMIAYADSFRDGEMPPLQVLDRFIAQYLEEVISGVHVLPFYPSSSDGGFAVADYLAVDPSLGSWDDVVSIGKRVSLMTDVVLNHVSRSSLWFGQLRRGEQPGVDYFITPDRDADLSAVVRPRTHPLLCGVDTANGRRQVWCTFSPDQVDLDYSNPDVMLEILRVINGYLTAGSRFLRLDAVAYLWKELGTDCIHLPQTHAVVRLLRTLLEWREPRALLVTETNVPNRENLTYFGNRNEAHAIYNFSLPPLIIDALLRGSAGNLQAWMMSMPPAPRGCTYLNFIASHDGIGLRPAEGILATEECDAMIATIARGGGLVSSHATTSGPQPYELNVSLFDALSETHSGPDEWHIERFLCAHTIMLALEGIPAIYFHSFLGSSNDAEAVSETGRYREINRRRLDYPEVAAALGDEGHRSARILGELCRRVRVRTAQPAFHPNATQFTLQLVPSVFAFWRQSIDRDQSIFALNNVSADPQEVALSDLNLIGTDSWRDLLAHEPTPQLLEDGHIELGPYQAVWLTNR